jgi:hypothetical protein
MQDIRYHIAQPSNKRDSYTQFDNIDFLLSAAGRKLVGGSVRLMGDVTVYKDVEDPTTENISFDGLTGSHAWFSQIITSGSQVGQIENLNFYPHMVSAKSRATLAREDTFQSQYTCQNICADGVVSAALLKGTTPLGQTEDYNALLTVPMNFAVRPDFCLNNFVVGTDNNLPFARVGDISISLIVSQSISVLYGTGTATPENKVIGIDRNILITNLRCMFTTVADDGKYAKEYQMRVATSLKQSLQSSYANISTLAPLLADRFWMVFIPQDQDNSPLYNGLACYRPPNVSRVEYLWSDNFSAMYEYAFINEEEMLYNGIRAVNGVVSDNQATLNILASNDGYILGMPFGAFIDLRKQKISVNLTSAITNTSPVTMYMFFGGVVSV